MITTTVAVAKTDRRTQRHAPITKEQQSTRLYTPRAGDHRPRDDLANAADPLSVGTPDLDPGLRSQVFCLMPGDNFTTPKKIDNVLMRADNPQVAYAPCSPPKKYNTLSGHLETCHVLKRLANGKFKMTPCLVAVKVSFQREMKKLGETGNPEDPLREIIFMQQIGCAPNMTTCLDVLYVKDHDDIGNTTWNVVMPHFGDGNLIDAICSSSPSSLREPSPRMTEDEALPLFRGIMQGLRAIHDAGICHHDLSPENIVVHNGQAFIIDFGMALRVPYTESGQRCMIRPQGAFGKPSYMAPEVFADVAAFDSEAIDVWSAGTILFCMVTGYSSYNEPQGADPLYRMMVNQLPVLLRDLDINLSKECVHLLRNMLRVTARLRYSIDEVLSHPWMKR